MEAVKNTALPAIEIYCGDRSSEPLAAAVGYGIEEEGLPYQIILKKISTEDAYQLTRRAGLGVVVLAAEEQVAVFTRQMKVPKPLFDSGAGAAETAGTIRENDAKAVEAQKARIMGKNAARIVKNKPFLGTDE